MNVNDKFLDLLRVRTNSHLPSQAEVASARHVFDFEASANISVQNVMECGHGIARRKPINQNICWKTY